MQAFVRIIIALAAGIVGVVLLTLLEYYVANGNIDGTSFESVWESIKHVATHPTFYAQVLGIAGFVGFVFVSASNKS